MYEKLTQAHIYTPGPVKMGADTLHLGGLQTPYFRNAEFSRIVLECEAMLLKMAKAPVGSRCVFLTAAGTAAMEATVMNLLGPDRSVGVVNGGTFGQRFVDICAVHHVPVQMLQVDRDPLTDGTALAALGNVGALLLNAHETSVGHCYDLHATGQWCRDKGALHIVDAISLFVTDPLDMQADSIDALIISSHKGLALPPGLAMVILSPQALAHVHPSGSYYLDFATHLRDGERGQTPFTPAVSIFLQLHQRLGQLAALGLPAEWRRAADLAAYFRRGVSALPLRFYSSHMPNAMTALEVGTGLSAVQVVQALEVQYDCVVAPNGGALRDRVFRVSHMGATDRADMDRLVSALTSILGDRK
jgi:aspartate aminotransferase-like enzyme